MKFRIQLFFLCIIFFAVNNVMSQDIITNKNGDEIKSKVLEITQTEIKYKKIGNANGPTYTIPKSDVFMIKYENGEKDVFGENNKMKNENIAMTSNDEDDLYSKGREDAIANYKGNNSGAGGTMATTVLTSPLLGLIPAAIITSNEPLNENLLCPNPSLMKKNSYRKGYIDQAYKIKRKKVWSAYGIGSAAWVILVILLRAA